MYNLIAVSTTQALFLLMPVAYLVGSFPFGLLIGLARGVDIRESGSGNIGATNLGRVLGRRYFWLAFCLDLLKGMLPMLAASWVISRVPASQRDSLVYTMWMAVGAAGVIGHVASVFLKFKGGKGVATSAGVTLGMVPYLAVPMLAAISVYVIVLVLTRYVSLASVIGVCSFPIFFVLIGTTAAWPVFGAQLPLLLFSTAIAALVVVRHRGNIARLRAGTETKIKWGQKEEAGQPGSAQAGSTQAGGATNDR
jgi:glycerol-3-phosphate acyltransferase PlsY